MVTQAQIEKLINTIVNIEQPEQVILFGSYAYGTPTENSDVDILVVKEYHIPRQQRGKTVLKALASVRFPLDILFYTPTEIEKWRHTRLAFVTTVISKGKIVYERKQRIDARMVPES